MMTKYDRIQKVKALGFNTENSILIKPGSSYEKADIFLKNYSQASIRTFRERDTVTPVYPIIKKDELHSLLDKLSLDGYYVILGTPVDPKDCEFAGAARKTESHLVLEIAMGPGTVRRVTHPPYQIDKQINIDLKYGLRHHYMTNDNRINEVIRKLKKSDQKNVIFEFSWYNKPIGNKKQNFIVWEITGDGTK